MVRPRFAKLAPAQQRAIVGAALQEFASKGFADASLNRIIESAGISKGSMYYYFDGKEDLYAHVIRDQLEGLLSSAGGFPVPTTSDPDEFWDGLADHYLRLMHALMGSPTAATLIRGWLNSPSLRDAQREAESDILPWITEVIAAGQRIGAVRTDLPVELLLAVSMAMGQAIDVWLIASPPGSVDLDDAVPTVIGMMRRALGP